MIRDDNTFLTKALHAYENRQCISLDEFKEDLYRINTIRKCIIRYTEGKELNIRIILNQCIILFNVFGQTAYDMLKYKLDKEYHSIIFVFLVQLNRVPMEDMIPLDQKVVDAMRDI